MYIYRVGDIPNFEETALKFAEMDRRFLDVNILTLKNYSPAQFHEDKKEFERLMGVVGWEGHKSTGLYVSTGLSTLSMGVTFIQRDGKSSDVFVGSPVHLAHLEAEAIDRSDSSEAKRTAAKMLGKEFFDEQPIQHTGWSTSRNGNPYTSIEGVNCVIIPSRTVGRVKGLLIGGGGVNKISTREFASFQECAQYIETHFRELIAPWTEKGKHHDPTTFNSSFCLDDE